MDRTKIAWTWAAIILSALASACGDDPSNAGDAGSASNPDAGMVEVGDATPRCTEPTPVACVEPQINQLVLFENVTSGEIRTESQVDGVFTDYVDATADRKVAPRESFVYARFTPSGLQRVEISDSQAFESMDWHIAFRRFVVRLNSGVSGPSCTQAAPTGTTDFDALVRVPEGLAYRTEIYMEPTTCTMANDTSGLPGSPAVALGGYWNYAMCVQMSDEVFVLKLADGRDVKFQVQSYYSPENQDECDRTGSVPMPSNAAEFRVKWAYLP